MSKKASNFQKKVMSLSYRGKENFKPLNTGRIDDHVACHVLYEWRYAGVVCISSQQEIANGKMKIKMSNRCNLGEMGQTKEMVFAILKKKAEIRFF